MTHMVRHWMMRKKVLLSTSFLMLAVVLTIAVHSALSNDSLVDDETMCRVGDDEDGDTCLLPDDFSRTMAAAADEGCGFVAEFFGVFRQLGVSWAHIIRSYQRIIGQASGQELKGDALVNTMDEGLLVLRAMISNSKADLLENDVMIHSHETFNKTRDDLLIAFLNWAATNEAKPTEKRTIRCRGGVNGRHKKINVSSAFRRLEVYNSWMKEAEKDLSSSLLLTASSVKEAWNVFAMHISHDECGRLAWWMDLNQTDVPRVKALPAGEIRRFFIWLAHVMIFDKGAQQNGIVFVNSLGDIGFWHFMTTLPLELGIKTDEFVICVVPLNTKLVLFLKRPAWVNFSYRLLKVFLKKEMKRRVVMVNPKKQQKIVEHAVGKNCIPDGFNGLVGNTSLGSIMDRYFVTAS